MTIAVARHTKIYPLCGSEATCIVLSHFDCRGEARWSNLHLASPAFYCFTIEKDQCKLSTTQNSP
jgi:hypothetical protein